MRRFKTRAQHRCLVRDDLNDNLTGAGAVKLVKHNALRSAEQDFSLLNNQRQRGADKGGLLGYKLQNGDRVIMIEDVTTSGKSMEETVPKVKNAADVTIVGLIVSLNRLEVGLGGKMSALDEIKEKYGFDTNAIVTMNDVTEYLYNKEIDGKVVIDDDIKSKIDSYYEEYGVKG